MRTWTRRPTRSTSIGCGPPSLLRLSRFEDTTTTNVARLRALIGTGEGEDESNEEQQP